MRGGRKSEATGTSGPLDEEEHPRPQDEAPPAPPAAQRMEAKAAAEPSHDTSVVAKKQKVVVSFGDED